MKIKSNSPLNVEPKLPSVNRHKGDCLVNLGRIDDDQRNVQINHDGATPAFTNGV